MTKSKELKNRMQLAETRTGQSKECIDLPEMVESFEEGVRCLDVHGRFSFFEGGFSGYVKAKLWDPRKKVSSAKAA